MLLDEVNHEWSHRQILFTLDDGLLVRSQYSEGPATGHLDTSFSVFPVSISKC